MKRWDEGSGIRAAWRPTLRSFLHARGPRLPQDVFWGVGGVGVDEHYGVDVVGEMEDRGEKSAGSGTGGGTFVPEPAAVLLPARIGSVPAQQVFVHHLGRCGAEHLVDAKTNHESSQ